MLSQITLAHVEDFSLEMFGRVLLATNFGDDAQHAFLEVKVLGTRRTAA
jgi:hypothetical protein